MHEETLTILLGILKQQLEATEKLLEIAESNPALRREVDAIRLKIKAMHNVIEEN